MKVKINGAWALAAGVGVLGLFGMIVALAFAGWKPESITGLFVGLGALLTTVVYAIRRSEVIDAKTDQQTEHLEQITQGVATVAKRVNGDLDDRIAAAMEEAAETGAARALAALRQQGVIR